MLLIVVAVTDEGDVDVWDLVLHDLLVTALVQKPTNVVATGCDVVAADLLVLVERQQPVVEHCLNPLVVRQIAGRVARLEARRAWSSCQSWPDTVSWLIDHTVRSARSSLRSERATRPRQSHASLL